MWWILDRLKSRLSQLYDSSNYSQTNLLPPCRKVCACTWGATSPRYCPLWWILKPWWHLSWFPLVAFAQIPRGSFGDTPWKQEVFFSDWQYPFVTCILGQFQHVLFEPLPQVCFFFLVVPKKSPLHCGWSCQGYCRRHLLCVCAPPVLSSSHRGPVWSRDLIPGSEKANLARFWRVSGILQCVPRCHILPCPGVARLLLSVS